MPELLREDLENCLRQTLPLWEEMRGQRIFLTGASGFFGCWLMESFLHANRTLQLGARMTILTRDAAAVRRKVPHLADEVEIAEGDVRSFPFPAGEFGYVIHAATDASAALNHEQPALMFDTIVEGTRRCLEFARAAHTRKFLFLSSGAVYGTQPPTLSHIGEEATSGPDPLNPANSYAEGKRAAELLCALYGGDGQLQVKIARCFAFAGPHMKLDQHFAIGNFIRDCMAGGPITVAGDGRAVRSYQYAGDLVVWLWTILLRGEPLRAYNVGSEEAVSIAELAERVARALRPSDGPAIEVKVLGKPSTAPAHRYVPSTARARQELGLACTVTLEEMVRRTRDWAEANTALEKDS
jgi:dTDP-glucose 4,6-dehydratase